MSVFSRVFQKLVVRSGAKTPSLDRMLALFDQELDHFQQLVLPTPESKPRTPFESTNVPFEKMSMANMTVQQMLSILPVMLPMQLKMRQAAKLYDGKFKATHSEASTEFFAQLEEIGYRAGATQIKYIRVPHYAIFKDKGIPHEFAILISVEMNKENISTAPSFAAFKEVAKGYKNLAEISLKMAGFMRRSGFAAYPGTPLGGLTDYTHLGELAGMGAIGYHGMLITPREGTRLRINTIYTNIQNLPVNLESENEHLWIRDFCARCKKCIRGCPVKAIFDEPQARGDGGMQCIDHSTCRDYFNTNFGCAICLAECPFSQVGYETIQSRFKSKTATPQFRIPVERINQ